MRIARTEVDLRDALATPRRSGATVGFVPTMGALHDGHLSLVRAARKEHDVVVLSIFVNPLQFGPTEDLAAYPRDEERDLDLARAEGIDLAFLPSPEAMYMPDHSTVVSVSGITDVLEGASRPGHFDGVCTVVAKLFNLVEPDAAYFGQKDAQQVAVVKRMVRDLSFRTVVVVCPIVREDDGLAMSSRNAYLGRTEREEALALIRSLETGRGVLERGGTPTDAEEAMTTALGAAVGVEMDYAAAVDPDTFEAAKPGGSVLLAVAARVGPARLIDNLLVHPREGT